MLLTTGKVGIHVGNRLHQTTTRVPVEMEHMDIVEQLLSMGKFDGNSSHGSGKPPLILAVQRRHENLVRDPYRLEEPIRPDSVIVRSRGRARSYNQCADFHRRSRFQSERSKQPDAAEDMF